MPCLIEGVENTTWYPRLGFSIQLSPLLQIDLPFYRHSRAFEPLTLCLHALQYLELALLIWSERLPLWRVEELVAVDVVQELTLQRHVDPEREGEIRG